MGYLHPNKFCGRVKWMPGNAPRLLHDGAYPVALPFNLNFNYKVVNMFRYDFVSAVMCVSMQCYSISLMLCHRLLRAVKLPVLVG